jgi:hypothetical protein
MEKVYQLLKETVDLATREIGNAKFDKLNSTHRTIMALYATIYEQVEAAIVLYEAKRYNGAILILRPILEANVDLINLITHPGYVGFLEWEHAEQLRKLISHGIGGKNPFLQGYADNPLANRRHKELKKEIKALEAKGYGKQLILQKFKKAGMEEEYQSAYNMLCSESHNNIRSLNERHIERVSENDFRLVVNAAIPENKVLTLLHGLLGGLMTASLTVHSHFNSPAHPKFEALEEQRAKLLKPLPESADEEVELKANEIDPTG